MLPVGMKFHTFLKDEALEGVMTVATVLSELCAELNKYAGQLEPLATNECLGPASAVSGGTSVRIPRQRVDTQKTVSVGRKTVLMLIPLGTERGRKSAQKQTTEQHSLLGTRKSSPVAKQSARKQQCAASLSTR